MCQPLSRKRLLFVTSTRLGDAVLSTGILKRLIERDGPFHVTVVCGPVAAPLFAAVPGLERVIPLQKKPHSLHWLDMWRACVGTLWHTVVDLRRAPLTRFLLSRRHLGLHRDRDDGHRVEMYGRVIDAVASPPAPHVWTSEADQARAVSLIPDGDRVLALGPSANWIGKTWPADRFAVLAERLTRPGGALEGAKVAVFGAASERSLVTELFEKGPKPRLIDLMGRVTVTEAAACLGRVRLFIGNDSGLMHLAAAAGTPTLGLFGPSREEHYQPWGAQAAAVRGVSYAETFPADYDYRAVYDTLMGPLQVDDVERATVDLLKRVGMTQAPGEPE